ncbi:DUF1616 domain-containing protein [Halomarina litorea]|uniref:DUF1616 domain-containing protein n=1 Tax=Halomarina litorea TaxID=2961595 RepID=UPI0020C4B62A|nr:DUF1616 domain-containing protein [Halomarina sp. BCD28]
MRSGRSAPRGSAVPVDLVFVLAYIGGVDALLLIDALGGPASPLRVLLTLPVLFFLPGYSLAAAAFPRVAPTHRGSQGPSLLDRVQQPTQGIDHVERAALGFGLSFALLPIVGLLVAATPGPVSARGSVVALTVVTALFAVVAAVRRWRLDPEERYTLPFGTWESTLGGSGGSALDAALSVVLALAILAAMGAGALAIAAPQDGTSFTNYGIGTINDSGEFVAADYPTEWQSGEPRNMAFQVVNHEDERVNYTVVVQMQRISEDGRVVELAELDRFNESIGDDRSWTQEHRIQPPLNGDRLQVVYLFYKGDPPSTPTRFNADEYVYFWTNVGSGGEESSLAGPARSR